MTDYRTCSLWLGGVPGELTPRVAEAGDAEQGAGADDASTQVAPPDAAATQVIPAAPIQVMLVAGGPGAAPSSPPFAPVPRTVTGGDRNTTLWLVVALAAVAVVAVVLVWAFALRDTGEQFVGNWTPADESGGGLVISLSDGDFSVTMYDEDLELLGTYPAVRDGDELAFRFTDTRSGRGQMTATLTLDEERDVLTQRLTAVDAQGAAVEYVRVDALETAATPSPTPSPTPTPTPTATSPSPSSSGSSSPSPPPTSTDPDVLDQRVVDGVNAIGAGIRAWANANGGVYPPVGEVAPGGGVDQYVSPWPTNPYTGQPMKPGTARGDYTYEQLDGGMMGQLKKLTGYLSDGVHFMLF